MKLMAIWLSNESWKRVLAIPMPPDMAYKLVDYHTKVFKALTVCATRSDTMKEKISKRSKDGVSMVGGTIVLTGAEDIAEHEAEFTRFLNDSDLEFEKSDLKLADIVAEIKVSGERVRTADLIMLRPFFADAPEEEKEKDDGLTPTDQAGSG